MPIGLSITVEPSEDATASLYVTAGNNKRRQHVKTFSKDDRTWTGHVGDGHDLIIQEEAIERPVKVRQEVA